MSPPSFAIAIPKINSRLIEWTRFRTQRFQLFCSLWFRVLTCNQQAELKIRRLKIYFFSYNLYGYLTKLEPHS